ncbi:hypothetical protein HEP84_25680 [Streptomyces sp. RLB1-33]|nr:hypothetical protein [Streptomyces sp. RLB1-33]QIY72033.1 hypothetical protein HEP84_25680 [Streptomyces sp. RLB1-33]
MTRKKFKDMQTPEQQHAAQQAHQLREAARSAEAEVQRLTAARRVVREGKAVPDFGPHSDRDRARVDQLQAGARDLRAAADKAERQKPKPKRRWF